MRRRARCPSASEELGVEAWLPLSAVPTPSLFHSIRRRGLSRRRSAIYLDFFLCLSHPFGPCPSVIFRCVSPKLGTDYGVKGSGNVPPSRGHQTGNLDNEGRYRRLKQMGGGIINFISRLCAFADYGERQQQHQPISVRESSCAALPMALLAH